MSRVCEICGKGKMPCKKVATHSQWVTRRTNKQAEVNLQTATVMVDGKEKRVKACTKCIKTINKKTAM